MFFFVPQFVNFAMSLPQLFRVVPCPRHRMPRLNPKTGLVTASRMTDDGPINLTLINLWLRVFGDRTEARLTTDLLVLQVVCCAAGFVVRYNVASWFY